MNTVGGTCTCNTYYYANHSHQINNRRGKPKFCAYVDTDSMFSHKQKMSSNNIKCQSSHEDTTPGPGDGANTNPYLDIYGPEVVFSYFWEPPFVFLLALLILGCTVCMCVFFIYTVYLCLIFYTFLLKYE